MSGRSSKTTEMIYDLFPSCESGRHTLQHIDMTCEQADDWIDCRNAWLKRGTAAILRALGDRTPMREVPATFRGPRWAEHHA